MCQFEYEMLVAEGMIGASGAEVEMLLFHACGQAITQLN